MNTEQTSENIFTYIFSGIPFLQLRKEVNVMKNHYVFFFSGKGQVAVVHLIYNEVTMIRNKCMIIYLHTILHLSNNYICIKELKCILPVVKLLPLFIQNFYLIAMLLDNSFHLIIKLHSFGCLICF